MSSRTWPAGGLIALLLLLLLLPTGAAAEEEPGEIAWVPGVGKAFEVAAAEQKPLMVCINSTRVDGGRVEPAAKELREVTYRDARVVEASRDFVCVFLTAEGSSDDYGELRLRYGLENPIISPQHIFAHADGTLIARKEYWPYGYGESSVTALLDLMGDALEKHRGRLGLPADPDAAEAPPPPAAQEAPEEGPERQAWIEEQMALGLSQDVELRRPAWVRLVEADRDGDTVGLLLEALEEHRRRPEVLVDVVRALGRPGLEVAAEPLEDLLGHRDEVLRANAAVSLEYIGAPTSVRALMRRAPSEKDEGIANHMYRALGRCGAGESKVRSLLVKKVLGAKSEAASYGPIVGLAYFERDEKTAREVEKLILKEGVGGGRRGMWRGALKRTLLVWCLTEVGFGDPKSAEFVREELIPSVTESPWADLVLAYYSAAAECCAGNEEARERIAEGVRRAIGFWRSNVLLDDARRGRETAGFEPKGEWRAEPRGP